MSQIAAFLAAGPAASALAEMGHHQNYGIREEHKEKTVKKYPACQECKHSGFPSCDPDCMEEIKREKPRSPADRIMTTIRDEVSALIAEAKLAGYRQAQREEFHHLCGLIGGPEPHDQIIERIRHLRKELGLGIIKNR